MEITISVSIGELFDRFTILGIKLDKIANPEIQAKLRFEYDLLKEKMDHTLVEFAIKGDKRCELIDNKFGELVEVNKKLWDIEDKLRSLESKKDFGKEFIKLARDVYKFNDERSAIKAKINKLFGSEIQEVKIYTEY